MFESEPCQNPPGNAGQCAGKHGERSQPESQWHLAVSVLVEQICDDVIALVHALVGVGVLELQEVAQQFERQCIGKDSERGANMSKQWKRDARSGM